MAIYMKFGDIKGQVKTVGFKDWIELDSCAVSINRHTTLGSGGRSREGAHPDISEIHVTKKFDKATPLILRESVAGTFDKKVNIKWTTTTKTKTDTYFHVELEKCGITQYSQTSSPDNVPMESLALNFLKVTFDPSPLDDAGTPVAGAKVSYDLSELQAG